MTHSGDGGVYTITLENYSYIKNIHIYNRLDCCSDRFLNADIKVDNNDILKIPQYDQQSSIISFNVNTFGAGGNSNPSRHKYCTQLYGNQDIRS